MKLISLFPEIASAASSIKSSTRLRFLASHWEQHPAFIQRKKRSSFGELHSEVTTCEEEERRYAGKQRVHKNYFSNLFFEIVCLVDEDEARSETAIGTTLFSECEPPDCLRRAGEIVGLVLSAKEPKSSIKELDQRTSLELGRCLKSPRVL